MLFQSIGFAPLMSGTGFGGPPFQQETFYQPVAGPSSGSQPQTYPPQQIYPPQPQVKFEYASPGYSAYTPGGIRPPFASASSTSNAPSPLPSSFRTPTLYHAYPSPASSSASSSAPNTDSYRGGSYPEQPHPIAPSQDPQQQIPVQSVVPVLTQAQRRALLSVNLDRPVSTTKSVHLEVSIPYNPSPDHRLPKIVVDAQQPTVDRNYKRVQLETLWVHHNFDKVSPALQGSMLSIQFGGRKVTQVDVDHLGDPHMWEMSGFSTVQLKMRDVEGSTAMLDFGRIICAEMQTDAQTMGIAVTDLEYRCASPTTPTHLYHPSAMYAEQIDAKRAASALAYLRIPPHPQQPNRIERLWMPQVPLSEQQIKEVWWSCPDLRELAFRPEEMGMGMEGGAEGSSTGLSGFSGFGGGAVLQGSDSDTYQMVEAMGFLG